MVASPGFPAPQSRELRDWINAGIDFAVRAYFKTVSPGGDPEPTIAQAQYEAELGAYIIVQNPYAAVENLALPKIPLGDRDETKRVRKNGVLREYSANAALPLDETIPAGEPYTYTFEDWTALRDDPLLEDDPTNFDPTKPPLDPPTDLGDPPNVVASFPHKIVKTLRFRYTLMNRKRDGKGLPAHIIVLYSGGSSH